MATKVILNRRGHILWHNFLNGFVIAVLTSGLTAFQQILDANAGVNFKAVLMAAISGGIGYILKKWLLDKPSVVTQYSSNDKAEQVAEDIR